jgi:hypothetical protein
VGIVIEVELRSMMCKASGTAQTSLASLVSHQ